MSEKLLPRLFVLFTMASLLLTACAGSGAKISVEPAQFDFGDVIVGEIVTRDLRVTNTGSGTLVIESISTSCGCTTAAVDQTQIPAGESTLLHITFDAGAHGDVTAFYTRQVFIATNDAEQPEMRIEFTANVIRGQGS